MHRLLVLLLLISGGHKGPIAVLDHLPTENSAAALKHNLDGLQKLFTLSRLHLHPNAELRGAAGDDRNADGGL